MPDVVIEISGGVLTAVYSDVPNLRVVSIDWDNAAEAPDPREACGVISHNPIASMPEDTLRICSAECSEKADDAVVDA